MGDISNLVVEAHKRAYWKEIRLNMFYLESTPVSDLRERRYWSFRHRESVVKYLSFLDDPKKYILGQYRRLEK